MIIIIIFLIAIPSLPLCVIKSALEQQSHQEIMTFCKQRLFTINYPGRFAAFHC